MLRVSGLVLLVLLLGAAVLPQDVSLPSHSHSVNTIWHGAGAPSLSLGTYGDFYIDTAATVLYGPKTAGGWGTGISLIVTVSSGGGSGSGSSSTGYSDAEVPGGSINGTNLAFTLAQTPIPALSLELVKNGMLMKQGADYTLTGSTVTFATGAVPVTGDSLQAWYRY